MVTLRNDKTLETPANPTTDRINENGHTQIEESHKKSDYEQAREQRIKENRERMEKLGIFDLSLKFKSVKPARKNSLNGKPSRCLSPLPARGPTRRSSRLQNATPVVYSEVEVSKKNRSTFLEDERDLLGEGSKQRFTRTYMKSCWATLRGVGLFSLMVSDKTGREFTIRSREKLVINAGRKPLVTAHTAANVAWSKDSFVETVCICGKQKDGLPLALFIGRFLSWASKVDATSEGNKLSISNDDNLSLVTTKDEENKTDDELKGVKIEEMNFVENKHGDSDIASKSSREPDEKSALTSESSGLNWKARKRRNCRFQIINTVTIMFHWKAAQS
ncbi:hypothetical protein C3L33_01189, partial [Rhododendron williamsianum]